MYSFMLMLFLYYRLFIMFQVSATTAMPVAVVCTNGWDTIMTCSYFHFRGGYLEEDQLEFSDFQTGISAVVLATLQEEQLISHTKTAIIDTTTSLQGSNGEVFLGPEVLDLPPKIFDILDKAVSKLVGNITLF